MFSSMCFAVLRKAVSLVLIVALLISPEFSYAQGFVTSLPVPGSMFGVSETFTPILVKGLVVHPDQPLNFDFIVDSGNDTADQAVVKEQSEKIARYFLAALTVPEDQLWVNLSPYEKDRMIDEGLGETLLGRDMLAQDYVLKQLSASLMYPEEGLGKEFWTRIYREAQEKFGTTDIPVDTFNKVWIVPQKAEVFEKGTSVYVTQAHLKVMLDSDYEAQSAASISKVSELPQAEEALAKWRSGLIRQIILPAIEKEVNEGKNFAALRQIYHAAILAKWYRELVQDTLMYRGYVGTSKINGVTSDEKELKEQIYQRYIDAYKKGVFDYIKEDPKAASGEAAPRKYFSGGLDKFGNIVLDKAQTPDRVVQVGEIFEVDFAMGASNSVMLQETSFALSANAPDAAMITEFIVEWGVKSTVLGVIAFAGISWIRSYVRWARKYYSKENRALRAAKKKAEELIRSRVPEEFWKFITPREVGRVVSLGKKEKDFFVEPKYVITTIWEEQRRIFREIRLPGGIDIVPLEKDQAQAVNKDLGGIDIKDINIQRMGNSRIHFNEAILEAIFNTGFNGFTPVFIRMTPVENVLALMGVKTSIIP